VGAADSDTQASIDWLRRTFAERLWLAVHLHCGQDDGRHLEQRLQLAASLQIPAVACGDVHMHARGRRALQDTMTAIRHHVPVADAGTRLHPNGERHLRSLDALAALYPQALRDETLAIAQRCTFDLGQLRYHYPRELVPEGMTPLPGCAASPKPASPSAGPTASMPRPCSRSITNCADRRTGLRKLFPHRARHRALRPQPRILCQGRGSAANSAVCFAWASPRSTRA
jgi:error-prone DNA polymerase